MILVAVVFKFLTIVNSPEFAVGGRPELPTIDTIRVVLGAIEFKQDRTDLIVLGTKAFPTYEQILNDPKATRDEIGRIFGVLTAATADRSRFLERAVAELVSLDSGVRETAVGLLAQIGSERDTPPVVALLSDGDITVGVAAAAALKMIGGPRDLVALNARLIASDHKHFTPQYQVHHEVLRNHVAKCRDELKQRLEKPKEAKE